MRPQDLTVTGGADRFYPTPPSVAEKMLAGIDWHMIETVLEPEAGKGDLILATARKFNIHVGRYHGTLDVDFCEIDPHLREICKYNIIGVLNDLREAIQPLDRIGYSGRTEEQKLEYNRLENEIDLRKCVDLHLVNDDFLTYHSRKQYDLIIMNPPFKDGDLHLLKALEIQKYGGSIVCLLNAETIRNPYTETRKLLLRELDRLGADIQYIEDAFSTDAERKADVDVAIIKIIIPAAEFNSTIYERMKKAVEPEFIPDPELQALVAGDYIDQAIQMYNVEVEATLAFYREYKGLIPYMPRSLVSEDRYGKSPIIELKIGDREFSIKKYMKVVRLKYWRALFSNEKFIGRLTSELREKFDKQVEKMADYEFSAFNIKQVLVEMNASMTQGVEKAIMDLFEKLTVEHSWYPECEQNRHYFNGWATNKAHKIGKKSIIPTYGMHSSWSWDKEPFNQWEAYKVISDIEKAFDYLDGGRTDPCDLNIRLKVAHDTGQNRNISCKYFRVDLFKKGTMHIKFHPEAMRLVERLNIYASRKKGWLPPNYGHAQYGAMAADEQAVVDSFHGDGNTGSGAKAYGQVMAGAAFYLQEPTKAMPALMAPAT